MIDIRDLKKNPDKYRKGMKAKQFDASVVDKVLDLDQKRRDLLVKIEKLRAEKNKVAKDRDIEKGKKIKIELQKIEPQLDEVNRDYGEMLRQIPNPPADDVKAGKDESENEILRKWGKPKDFSFQPKSFWELGESLNIIDTERASKVSGTRFFYLKGDGVLLDMALVRFAFETLLKEGFTPIIPPVLIKEEMMEGMGYLEHGGKDEMYVLKDDGLILVGTSEQSMGPMHAGETFNEGDLPRRYLGYSSCFRREAGSYGKDTKGAFRVHQFNKVEMFSFCKPEDGDKEHEFLLSMEEKMLQALELPYQVVKMCSGDLGAPAARKYDLEGWFPSQKKYRELTSASTTTDFQARGLNIKYMENREKKFVHMLNGTAFSQRPILAILENYQQEDGSVLVPKLLQKWVGKEKITAPQK